MTTAAPGKRLSAPDGSLAATAMRGAARLRADFRKPAASPKTTFYRFIREYNLPAPEDKDNRKRILRFFVQTTAFS